RSGAWLKVKPTQSADFVVGGYTKGKGAREPLGAILVGYWDKGKLRYASHVGSGFNDVWLKEVTARLEPLRRTSCPFVDKPELNAPTTWVEPKLVVEVEFHSWTDDGALRAPVFLRLRDDIAPKTVRRSDGTRVGADSSARAHRPHARSNESGPTGVIGEVVAQLEKAKNTDVIAVGRYKLKVTHLDRAYWPADPGLNEPALTKRDLLRY